MRHILVGTDLSDGAHAALIRAVAIAAQSHAALVILHAAPAAASDHDGTRRAIRASAQSEAKAIGAQLEIHVHVMGHNAEQSILRETERCGADLVVLGGHGTPRFRDAVFGTVGTYVARHSPVPVLIVQTDPSVTYSRLLVAADKAETAPGLVEKALVIAPSAEVFMVHAFHASLARLLAGDAAIARAADDEEAPFRDALARVAAAHPKALVSAHRHLIAEPGEIATLLMDETERLVPDLVVMGTRQRGTFFGSHAADTMFWCPADLLIVPESAAVAVAA